MNVMVAILEIEPKSPPPKKKERQNTKAAKTKLGLTVLLKTEIVKSEHYPV